MMVGTDLCDFESNTYLLTVDYYSKFIEVDRLQDLGSKATIEVLNAQFCRHGIPEVIRSYRGPQFASKDFARFCKEYGIAHKTSSPHFPSANGEVERAVQTVKQLALLDYRTTPLEGVNLSPAQLLMGRRPRNKLPSLRELLTPTAYNRQDVMQRLNQQKANQKFYHDSKPTSDLPLLLPGSKRWNPAIVVNDTSAHALTLWNQVGTSTAANEDTYIDQPKLPILLNTAQISQQMMVHPI